MFDKRETISKEMLLAGIDIKFLLKGLQSDNDIEVLYYLDLLENIEYEEFSNILNNLAKHKSKRIRKSIFERVDNLDIQVYKKTIQECLKSEKKNDILSIIIKLYCKLDSEDITNKIVPYLTNENELIKKATIFALIKYGNNKI